MRPYASIEDHQIPATPKLLPLRHDEIMAPTASDHQIPPLSLDTMVPLTSSPASPPLISPARPINPPEKWYAAPTSPTQPARRSNGTEGPRRGPSETNLQSRYEIGHEVSSRLADKSTSTSTSTPTRPACATTTTAADVEEAYWRVGICSSELGPGEGWYAQRAHSSETQATPLLRKNDGGEKSKPVGHYECEDKGGTREFGPGIEWYL